MYLHCKYIYVSCYFQINSLFLKSACGVFNVFIIYTLSQRVETANIILLVKEWKLTIVTVMLLDKGGRGRRKKGVAGRGGRGG